MSLLENMRIFVRVVELGSLTMAGRNLRVSPAVASHRLKELEKHLGVRLLNRTTRQLHPTEQGLVYYRGCVEVLHALEIAESSVAEAGGALRGAVKVTAPLGLGRTVVGPAVPLFREKYPEIDVRLRLSDHLLDLLREGADASIRLARIDDSSFTMRKIFDCERVLCAAPAYLARRGVPSEPPDLMRHDCLLLRFPGSQQYQWDLTGPDGPARLPVRGPMDADDGEILTNWAVAGHGIVLRPLFEVATHLRSGALMPVLLDFPAEPVTLAMLYPHRKLLAPKVKAFADFMVDHCGSALRGILGGMSLATLRAGQAAREPAA